MKKLISKLIITLALSIFSIGIFAHTTSHSSVEGKPTYVNEYNLIVEVLNKYIEGGKQANSSIMKPSFNEKATIFSIDADNKLTGGAIEGLFETVDKSFKPSPNAKAVISYINIVGNAASARIDLNDISGFYFTDFFNLLKIDGKWSIVSKIYYQHPVKQ